MFRHLLSVTILLGMLATSALAAEKVAFPSATDWGDPTKLTGLLSKPSGDGPFPAVVLLHQCMGIGDAVGPAWEKRLVGWGYVVLRIDSLAPRGLKNVCAYETKGSYDGDVFESDTRVEDANGGKNFLATLPYVAKHRIALMGWSHGGAAVLFTLVTEAPTGPFKAAVALYPGCGVLMAEINAPLLIQIGEKDTWSVAAVCKQLEQPSLGTLRFERIVYPGAHHGFDEAGADRTEHGHTIRHDAKAAADASERIKAFLAKHLK